MERIINKLIDDAVANVDTYTNNGSTWLIFTDDKRWVIELTKDGTLWYNYNFFNNLFTYTSMDVIENQHYITKWVENNIINKKKPVKNGVKDTSFVNPYFNQNVEDTIQNGVKETKENWSESKYQVEDTIQNGVKHTEYGYWEDGDSTVEYTIQNGVKNTELKMFLWREVVEDIIQNGVKHTEKSLQIDGSCVIEDVIKEGVKHTEYGDWEDGDERLDDIIQNGVKEIGHKKTHDDVYPHTARIEGVIKNGIKEVQPLPAQYGNRDWGLYYNRKEDRTKPFTEYVKDVIENGNKLHDI